MMGKSRSARLCAGTSAHGLLCAVLVLVLGMSGRLRAEDAEEIDVIGKREAPPYYTPESTSATKTATSLREIPQSVRVLSRAQIGDIGATRLDETLSYVSGISHQNGFGGLWDNFAVRGFAGDANFGPDFFVNGFSANRGFSAPRDTANVERIEFLKGPASALYGRGDPGGTIHVVTKPPLFERTYGIGVSVGSFRSYRTSADLTGPIREGWAYRLNVALEDKDSFRDEIDTKRQFLAPSLLWRIGDETRATYTGEFLRNETPLDRGVVAVGGQLGVIPVSRNLAEPGDSIRSGSESHQLVLEHAFSDRWSARVGLSYKTAALKGFSTEASRLEADQRSLRRQRRFRDYASEDLAGQAELTAKLETGGIGHQVLVGVEAYAFQLDQLLLRANPTDASPFRIDIFEPVFGQPRPIPGPNTQTREQQRNRAVYLQDQIELGARWRALLGVRYDRYRQELRNRRTASMTRQGQSEYSPRLGLVFLASERVSLYASAARSFRPNSGSDALGRAFEPEFARSYELGLKAETLDRRLGATLALFHIEKENVLTVNPANTAFSIAAGEARSRGFELDLAGELGSGWRVSASYGFVDVEVTKDSVLRKGIRLVNVPRHGASALAVYEFKLAEGRALGIGGGMTYVGERLGDQADERFRLEAYTTAKLLAYYQISPHLRFALDVDNLFDREHYVSSFSSVWVAPGTERSIRLSAQGIF